MKVWKKESVLARETLAALIKSLIVLAESDPEKESEKRYTRLIGELSENSPYRLKVEEIIGVDEVEEFRKVKEDRVRILLITILMEAAGIKEEKTPEKGKYTYLLYLIKALSR